MSPEYLEELADRADPDKLWRLGGTRELSADERKQRDTGVALRRHATHIRRLHALIGTGRSLLLTPLSPGVTDVRDIETPPENRRARRATP